MNERHFLVEWSIDIDATSPEVAALEALGIQHDDYSWATIFVVTDQTTGTKYRVDTFDLTNPLVTELKE